MHACTSFLDKKRGEADKKRGDAVLVHACIYMSIRVAHKETDKKRGEAVLAHA